MYNNIVPRNSYVFSNIKYFDNVAGPHTVDPGDATMKDLEDFFVNAGFSTNPEQRAYEYYKPHLGNMEWVGCLHRLCAN